MYRRRIRFVARPIGGLIARNFRQRCRAPVSPRPGPGAMVEKLLDFRFGTMDGIPNGLTLCRCTRSHLGKTTQAPRCRHTAWPGAVYVGAGNSGTPATPIRGRRGRRGRIRTSGRLSPGGRSARGNRVGYPPIRCERPIESSDTRVSSCGKKRSSISAGRAGRDSRYPWISSHPFERSQRS
jgi:hypothetical protein